MVEELQGIKVTWTREDNILRKRVPNIVECCSKIKLNIEAEKCIDTLHWKIRHWSWKELFCFLIFCCKKLYCFYLVQGLREGSSG